MEYRVHTLMQWRREWRVDRVRVYLEALGYAVRVERAMGRDGY